MSSYHFTEADRDTNGRIRTDQPSNFAALLDDTMAAVGAAPAASEPPAELIRAQLGRHTYLQLAGALAIIGLMVALAFLAFRGDATPAPAAPADRPAATDPGAAGAGNGQRTTDNGPTPAANQIDAYAAPGGVRLGPIPSDSVLAYRDSRSPGWAGVAHGGGIVWVRAEAPATARDLAPPTPAPAPPRPQIVYVAPPCDVATNPAYRVQEDVYDGARPLGQVVGVSCNSQEEAQQNADTRAAELRAAQPTAAPEPTKTAIVPRPPVGRPKPMQPPPARDSGQSPIEVALWAAGWPVASMKGVLP